MTLFLVPFGVALALALAATLIGRPGRQRYIGLAVGIVALAAFGYWSFSLAQVVARGPVDPNPPVTDADLLGRWQCRDSVFSFDAPGTGRVNGIEYSHGEFHLDAKMGQRGRWSRTGWNLSLGDVHGKTESWRIVKYGGEAALWRNYDSLANSYAEVCERVAVR